ncbi:MAG: hypothetical protein JWO11_2046 [Nocardioides sp.]|nr:hypothetical protein [Nocardioides sp.]
MRRSTTKGNSLSGSTVLIASLSVLGATAMASSAVVISRARSALALLCVSLIVGTGLFAVYAIALSSLHVFATVDTGGRATDVTCGDVADEVVSDAMTETDVGPVSSPAASACRSEARQALGGYLIGYVALSSLLATLGRRSRASEE